MTARALIDAVTRKTGEDAPGHEMPAGPMPNRPTVLAGEGFAGLTASVLCAGAAAGGVRFIGCPPGRRAA